MYDCIVVGAGLAGLTAATSLVSRDKNVLVLEARDRVGGRIVNDYTSAGALIEHGGQWIIEGHQRVQELVEKHHLTPIPPSKGDFIIRMGATNHRVPVRAEADQILTPFQTADIGQALVKLRRLAGRLETDPIWSQVNDTWLSQPLTRWITSCIRIPTAREYFSKLIGRAFLLDVSNATLIDALHKLPTAINLEQLIVVSGALPQYRTAEGFFKVCDDLANDLGERIRLSSAVSSVSQDETSVTVTTEAGDEYSAATLVLALAPQMVKTLEFEPALPKWRYLWEGKILPGNVIKAHVVYKSSWWREDGLSGQIGADEGPVRVTFDTSPEDGSCGIIMGFFEGAEASGLNQRSITLRERAFVDCLVNVFGNRAKKHIGYYETDWEKEPYTRGSYGAHFAPGMWTSVGSSLAEPEGNIFFCGSEYSAMHNGYLEGAVISAENTVIDVIRYLNF